MDTKQTPTFVKFHTISSVCGCSFLHSCSSFLGFCHILFILFLCFSEIGQRIFVLAMFMFRYLLKLFIYLVLSISKKRSFCQARQIKKKKQKNSWLIKFESFVQKLIAHSTKNLHCICGLVIDTHTQTQTHPDANVRMPVFSSPFRNSFKIYYKTLAKTEAKTKRRPIAIAFIKCGFASIR